MELNRDLDFVNILLETRNIKKKHKDRLERKCNIQRKRLNTVREEMKQRIKAVAVKILISVEAQTFWRDTWNESKEHHKDDEWLKDVKKELEQDEGQDKTDTTKVKC